MENHEMVMKSLGGLFRKSVGIKVLQYALCCLIQNGNRFIFYSFISTVLTTLSIYFVNALSSL